MRHADNLETRPVVTVEQFGHGHPDRMLSEIARHIRDSQLGDLGTGRVEEGRLGDRRENPDAIPRGIQPHRWLEPESERGQGIDEASLGDAAPQSVGKVAGGSPIGHDQPADRELAQRARIVEGRCPFVAGEGFFTPAQRPKRKAAVIVRLGFA